MGIYFGILVVVLGLCIGSFLNVCIYRMPMEQSIVFPPSHCFHCDERLRARDLIPVLSYIFLRGKCRYCGEPVSSQYVFIEALNALCYFLIYQKYGLTYGTVFYCALVSLLIVISAIDFKYQLISDKLNLFGLILGIVFLFFEYGGINGFWMANLLGLAVGGGLFLLIVLLTGAMGGGDVLLMAVLGFWFGMRQILLIALLSFVIGAIISVLLIALKQKTRKDFIAFGPFIGMAAVVVILYGDRLWMHYLHYMYQ